MKYQQTRCIHCGLKIYRGVHKGKGYRLQSGHTVGDLDGHRHTPRVPTMGKASRVTVLHPSYKPDRRNPTPPTLADYISVPRLSLYSRTQVLDLLPAEQVAKLAAFANQLDRKRAPHQRKSPQEKVSPGRSAKR